jgi:hypothetical protein
MAWNGVREPVRPTGMGESHQLAEAGTAGPYVAWRGEHGALRVHVLGPRAPATIGRSQDGTIWIQHPQVSREHAEVTVRVHDQPSATCVYLLDYSKHGTEHRTVTLGVHGAERLAGPWQRAPRSPARAWQLDAGAHDVRLAGECCLLIGSVPVDDGSTRDREDSLPAPTVRQRDVLVELCRPFFEAPNDIVAPPTNAQIRARVKPQISEAWVSDLLGELYRLYNLHGTPAQNRVELVNLARRHDLVDASDYR